MYPDIVVIGSLNMDLVVRVKKKPEWGETVLGEKFFMGCGGKGANQAFAAGKLGAKVAMLGCVGQDSFGEKLLENLNNVGVQTKYIKKVQDVSTGVALINISSEGQNCIVVDPGANHHVTPDYIQAHADLIGNAKIVLVQLEIPLESVLEVAKICHQRNVPLLLDPAPAMDLPDDLLGMVDYIVPNESEISIITGLEVNDILSAKNASVYLLNKGVKNVFAKLGANGVVVTNANRVFHIEGYQVETVDTTAAGDAFAGALATALVNGNYLWAATQYANAVGALTVTKSGAQESMPSKEEVEEFIKNNTFQ